MSRVIAVARLMPVATRAVVALALLCGTALAASAGNDPAAQKPVAPPVAVGPSASGPPATPPAGTPGTSAVPPSPRAPAAPVVMKPGVASMCDLIAKASRGHGLPVDYFTRLIWQESRFRADALSPAGAQGIAQFMPRTASGRGLADPFSIPDALEQSAAYLQELRQSFGNLGLAAAAYNAGPGRLARFLAGETDLPAETIAYVDIVTGHSVEEWRASPAPAADERADVSCPRIAALAGRASVIVGAMKPAMPAPIRRKDWAVILLGNPQRDKAVAEYQIVKGQYAKVLGGVQTSVVHRRIGGLQVARYIVQIERDRREDANALCSSLLRAGGACFVLANKF